MDTKTDKFLNPEIRDSIPGLQSLLITWGLIKMVVVKFCLHYQAGLSYYLSIKISEFWST